VSSSRYSLTLGQKSASLKIKLDSVIARLDRLCLQDDDDGIWDENKREHWAGLFEWVFGVNYKTITCHRSLSTSTLRRIRDTGNVLYNRINAEGYKESQDDIQAVSEIAEDIRDALLDYQVCSNNPHTTGVHLRLGCLDRQHSNRRYTTRTAS